MGKSSDRFLVVTHVPHIRHEGRLYAYGPYVREMNIWLKYVDQFVLVAPLSTDAVPSAIDLPYGKAPEEHCVVESLNLSNPKQLVFSVLEGAKIMRVLFRQMGKATHIHLRCPGNMGLLGCLVQLFFPSTKKTAKYAGNWDWRSKEPLSYRLQQYILRSPILTSNMQALVYGNWPDRTKNIKPFFTATYSEHEKEPVVKPDIKEGLNLIYIGALEAYKSPKTVLEVAAELKKLNIKFEMAFCGDGSLRRELETYVSENNLSQEVAFLGNVSSSSVKEKLMTSHFLVFLSNSEGWPKAVAESMFWGCVPITTDVSCVGDMVGRNEERGILVPQNPEKIVQELIRISSDPTCYKEMSSHAMDWSREYTLERFEREIKELL